MTSDELAFIAALDAEPGDHTTRLVYADWLDDRGDPRGPGMRALGRLGICAARATNGDDWFLGRLNNPNRHDARWTFLKCLLPLTWFQRLPRERIGPWDWWYDDDSRAAAEDAAALAWAKLTPEQQARIFADAGVMV